MVNLKALRDRLPKTVADVAYDSLWTLAFEASAIVTIMGSFLMLGRELGPAEVDALASRVALDPHAVGPQTLQDGLIVNPRLGVEQVDPGEVGLPPSAGVHARRRAHIDDLRRQAMRSS